MKHTQHHPDDVNLKTLEIAFDRTCQFACSYCNPAFSSTWVRDIKTNGPYTSLVSDGRNHFTHTHDASQLYTYGETNPYTEAFFAWWESDLHKTLQELRITGGEPLMSGETWKLLDWFKANKGKSRQTSHQLKSGHGSIETVGVCQKRPRTFHTWKFTPATKLLIPRPNISEMALTMTCGCTTYKSFWNMITYVQFTSCAPSMHFAWTAWTPSWIS
jgi:hypothetical protein